MPLESHEPAEAPTAQIPARSRSQAMDWSLVLASQGIEHAVERPAEAGWGLRLAGTDYERALAVIRQYQRENRHWPWRKAIPHSGEIFDWGVVGWVLLNVMFYYVSDRHPDWRNAALMDGGALAHGEWWRLFTATLLHADFAHLTANALFGFVLLGLAMGRLGTGIGLLATLLAGAVGNLTSWWVRGDQFHGLGASGVVMGALGLVTVQSFALLQKHPRAGRIILVGLAGGAMLFTLLGLSPEADVVAHFGGFLAGIVFGFLLSPPQLRRRTINIAAGILFAALILWTWKLAISHAT